MTALCHFKWQILTTIISIGTGINIFPLNRSLICSRTRAIIKIEIAAITIVIQILVGTLLVAIIFEITILEALKSSIKTYNYVKKYIKKNLKL